MRALIVHGGAWAIPDAQVAAHAEGCRVALEAGWAVLAQNGSALDAVEAAVRVLEDTPIFDAGVGSVLNHDGDVELDAAVMEGSTLRYGAVLAVRHIRNPISLARQVMDDLGTMLVGAGAERRAPRYGIALIDNHELIVERERQLWADALRKEHFDLRRQSFEAAEPLVEARPSGTVGAVALDDAGRLAVGNSTGGTMLKPTGRVGDTPLVGCGLYVDDQSGGCACTGLGETIVRATLARRAVALLEQGLDPMAAAEQAVRFLGQRVDGRGGLIMLDRQGRVGFAFNTPRMAFDYRQG